MDAYWRAANYLSVGQIYLYDDPLLKRPLALTDVKHMLLGHWGTTPGQNFVYVHLNRVINKYDLVMIYVSGPGHGRPVVVGKTYLEGTYSEGYPHISQDEAGFQNPFLQFSFPGGISSHASPECPGSIHEGGVLDSMLSEHQCEGWLEGYLLTGRHGIFNCYEAFIHIIDSMFNQHAKWLKVTSHLPWRRKIASLNYLVASHVWRQDHNGFTHQDPGFIDHVVNKKAEIVRVYLPPDANCLLSVMDHCLRSRHYVNVVIAGILKRGDTSLTISQRNSGVRRQLN